MTVGVVVPCRNEAKTIGRLLAALATQTHRPDQVVIVDDRSTDETAGVIADWIARHPELPIDVIPGPARGVAAALNAGIRRLATDTVFRFDGHSVPEPDYVERALTVLAGNGARIVGGVWIVEAGAPTSTARAIAAVVSHPLGSGGARYRDAGAAGQSPESVETVPFGAFSRRVWEDLGGYDESLIANEDFDFNFRARRTGVDVLLDPRLRSTYFARATLAQLARQYHRYGFWKVRMLQKDARGWHWRQGPPAAALPWLLASVVWAVSWPGPLSIGAAVAYPVLVTCAAAELSVRRLGLRCFPLALCAFVVVHLSWSAGFWRALMGARPPRT